MISLKKYLDRDPTKAEVDEAESPRDDDAFPAALSAYSAAMLAMGDYSLDACAALGDGLKRRLSELQAGLSPGMSLDAIETTDRAVQDCLREWGQRTARYYLAKAGEVRGLLLTVAQTGEALAARDRRCASQMSEVTARLEKIATLDDVTKMRASIEKSTVEIRGSIERMTAEGKAALEELNKQVGVYRLKLEEAEEQARRDKLTGLRSRAHVEKMIERRIEAGAEFCVAMIDIDNFKSVNDTHGHLMGDELLKQFSAELSSACRTTDVIGRWGGDEFVVLLDCRLTDATSQLERLRKWICGDYAVQEKSGVLKLRLDASMGVAEYCSPESMKDLMGRADAAMYEIKGRTRIALAG